MLRGIWLLAGLQRLHRIRQEYFVTHDTTSYINNIESVVQWNDQGYAEANNTNYWYWGYEFNKTIRASVGLDRYGALKEYYTQRAASSTGEEQKRDQEYLNTLNSYTFDEIKEPNSDNDLMQKEGLTKYTDSPFPEKLSGRSAENRQFNSKVPG